MDETITGRWWFSDQKKDNAISGNLLLQKGRLELNGLLNYPTKIKTGDERFIKYEKKTILGISKTGKFYTLEFDEEPSRRFSQPGYKTETYILGRIFEGAHFQNIDDIKFEKYHFEFPYLYEWFGLSSLSLNYDFEKKTTTPLTIQIKNNNPFLIYKNDKIKIFYQNKINTKIDSNGMSIPKGIKIEQQPYLILESLEDEIKLSNFYTVVEHLKRFLILGIGKYFSAKNYEGIILHKDKVKIFLDSKKHKKIFPQHMNFTFFEIKDDIQIVLNNWFKQKEKYEDVFDIFYNFYRQTDMNINNQFKDICSSIEGYVRIMGKASSLLNSIRLLNNIIPKEIRPIDKNQYERINFTRNKLTHIRQDEKNIIPLNEKEKVVIIRKLKFILEYSFLSEIGVNKNLLQKFYDRNKSKLTINN